MAGLLQVKFCHFLMSSLLLPLPLPPLPPLPHYYTTKDAEIINDYYNYGWCNDDIIMTSFIFTVVYGFTDFLWLLTQQPFITPAVGAFANIINNELFGLNLLYHTRIFASKKYIYKFIYQLIVILVA